MIVKSLKPTNKNQAKLAFHQCLVEMGYFPSSNIKNIAIEDTDLPQIEYLAQLLDLELETVNDETFKLTPGFFIPDRSESVVWKPQPGQTSTLCMIEMYYYNTDDLIQCFVDHDFSEEEAIKIVAEKWTFEVNNKATIWHDFLNTMFNLSVWVI
jgi:hypothetical protein